VHGKFEFSVRVRQRILWRDSGLKSPGKLIFPTPNLLTNVQEDYFGWDAIKLKDTHKLFRSCKVLSKDHLQAK
jgi:hypothetical protein